MYLARWKARLFAATGVRAGYLQWKIDLHLIINTPISQWARTGVPRELKIAIKVNSLSALEPNLKP